MSEESTLFELQDVRKSFQTDGGTLKAVDGITLQIRRGEVMGLVGESGCGKSTLGRLLVRLYTPTEGDILFEGSSIRNLKRREAKEYTAKVQMIFQESYSSLNPRMTIGDSIKEGMRIHRMGTAAEIDRRMYELLEMVGLNESHASRFPYEFSGGMRQRVGIARALAVNPRFIVCDEPISAQDVSIQSQIMNLLQRLHRELDLTYLFISHDLSAVRYMSDRIGVMYLGSLVETAPAEELYINPLHPYTQALLSAVPKADPDAENKRERIVLEGDVPSPINIGEGCRFAGRCRFATEQCRSTTPHLQEIGKDHAVACHRVREHLSYQI